jgi:hypothetical protein
MKKRNEILYKKKTNILRNKNIDNIKSDKNLINILYSIEEYYYYNEQAYNEFIENLELFLKFFNFVTIDNSLGGQLYRNLLDYKKLIINCLISMSIKLPPEYNLQEVIQNIESILDDYLYKTKNIYEEYLKKNGIDHTTKLIILKDIEPYNENYNIFHKNKQHRENKYLYFNR